MVFLAIAHKYFKFRKPVARRDLSLVTAVLGSSLEGGDKGLLERLFPISFRAEEA